MPILSHFDVEFPSGFEKHKMWNIHLPFKIQIDIELWKPFNISQRNWLLFKLFCCASVFFQNSSCLPPQICQTHPTLLCVIFSVSCTFPSYLAAILILNTGQLVKKKEIIKILKQSLDCHSDPIVNSVNNHQHSPKDRWTACKLLAVKNPLI